VGYSEMLLEDAEDLEKTILIPDLKKIHLAGQRLFALINDVIDLARMAAGKLEFDLKRSGAAPMIQDVVTTIRTLEEENLTARAGGRLLVVDDNELNRALLSRRLERQGFTVAVAENGRQALEIITRE